VQYGRFAANFVGPLDPSELVVLGRGPSSLIGLFGNDRLDIRVAQYATGDV
jgi:hypothetical protein